MADKHEYKSNKSNSPGTSLQPVAQHVTPSRSFTPLKDYDELRIADENLPSKDIAQLWQRPLKLSNSQTYSNPASPNAQNHNIRKRIKNQPTPTRRSVLPPTKLVFDHGVSDEKISRAGYRRSMSFPERGSCVEIPVSNPKRLKLFNDENSPYEELLNSKPTLKEVNKNIPSSSSLTPAVKKLFVKSQSDSTLSSSSSCIKTAVEKIEGDPNLIGDASTSYMLPVKNDGKHPGLKEITAETLAKLLEAKEDCDPGVTFKIIDCRYPYEFEGGHIRGALNLYTKTHIQDELMECKTSLNSTGNHNVQKQNNIREILIFHCEFSSRRGPFLCRYLRDIDRYSNEQEYPMLFYPELYVLYGGYKEFFGKYPNLCDPSAYVHMSHPAHADKYRRYKSQSKLGFGA